MSGEGDINALDAAAREAGLILDRPGEYAPPVDEATKRTVSRILGPMGNPRPTGQDGPAFVPPSVNDGRVFGVALQLYQLRSDRNLGVGDLGDLRTLLPYFAGAGVDFVGLNPLHALFTAAPDRASPFAPSDRQFLNPFIVAVDDIIGAREGSLSRPDVPDSAELVDYDAVGPLKIAALKEARIAWKGAADADEKAAHAAFVSESGDALQSFATFEAISHAMAAQGLGAGSASWPAELATRNAPGVAAFAREHADDIAFHAWLQFVADQQLGAAQAAAISAGMRIGLYLDLAVGTAPDGHATWAEPDLSVKGLVVGAPPDLFSSEGQSWGLAPISPAALIDRDYAPYRAMLAAVMRHAGAVRIDHAMGLERLWLLPEHESAKNGVYVRQPGLVDELVAATHRHRTVAIGEDLGIVPPGFRDRMNDRRIFSMRIMMFEREEHQMRPPEWYPPDAMACLSTHDFAPLEAWWAGDDLAVRSDLGVLSAEDRAAEETERARVKHMLLALMALPPEEADRPLSDAVRVAYHAAVARTTSRMMAVRLEDVVGGRRLVNVPGTDREHPNWRRTLPLTVPQIMGSAVLRDVLTAVRAARA